jgi:hypothetical protein
MIRKNYKHVYEDGLIPFFLFFLKGETSNENFKNETAYIQDEEDDQK